MPSFLERLRRTLAPGYEVERELTSGGMGLVFLARDIRLERRVAIKVMRPELATAQAAERFLREARILAKLTHPNVVAVHSAGEAEGLFYYVMDYIDGETLADRLTRGPLPPDEALKLGRDLLDGLQAAHRVGVVHRDIKPSNVFRVEGRALLADFGIAKPMVETAPPTTGPGAPVGTPGYMPPEQAVGGAVTPRTDLYAVGMLLYEAYTGRRWSILTAVDRADFSGVPPRVAGVLRRALAWAPEDRWDDAAAFHHALAGTRTGPSLYRTVARAAAGVAAVALAAFILKEVLTGDFGRRGPPLTSLAILPFDVVDDSDRSLGENLARIAAANLEVIPDLTLTPTHYAFRWWEAVRRRPGPIPDDAFDDLQAKSWSRGAVLRVRDSVEVRLRVQTKGRRLLGQAVVRAAPNDLAGLGDAISLELIRIVAPEMERSYPDPGRVGCRNVQALGEFLHGEDAFHRNDWSRALRHYEAAVALDSTCTLARWRSWNAWRWLGMGTAYPKLELERFYADQRGALGELDRLLIEAQLAPFGPVRFRKYEDARRRYPRDGYAALLYGDELLTRGALAGVPLTEAQKILSEAATTDSFLALAYMDLAMLRIRLGRREEARRAIDRLAEIWTPPEEAAADRYFPPLLEQAFLERFEPERAAAGRERVFGQAGASAMAWLALAARWSLWFDLPKTQLAVAARLTATGGADPDARASGLEAQALALFALGRTSQAWQGFDSAAALLGAPKARLQAAEWRVLPAALGMMPGSPHREVEKGRKALERWVADPELGARAAWALAIDAYGAGDTVRALEWRARLRRAVPPDSATAYLEAWLSAMQEAARGRVRSALEISEPIRSFYVLRKDADPFARAVLNLKRGEWFLERGRPEAADSAWLWYENQDLMGDPSGEAQAAEVDWAMGTYARFRRGVAARERGDDEAACTHLARVAELWARADAPLAGYAREASNGATRACSP